MISVIIPVYNVEESLQRMIDCLLGQEYPDFEVILIDDGSIDGSSYICDKAVEQDSRFYVLHQCNSGVSTARNQGLKSAKGEYIVFLDADDEIPSNYLETLVSVQQKTQSDIVVCDVVMIQAGEEVGRFTHDDVVFNNTQALNLLLSRKNINSGPCAKLIKRDVIGSSVFPRLKVYEDILFVRDVFENACTIAVTSITEYRYIQNTNSAMHQIRKVPSEDIISATKDLVHFIERHKELSPECMYITMSHLFQYVHPIIKDENPNAVSFVNKTRRLYRKHLGSIMKCKAFPWKEKVLFVAVAYNLL